MDIWIYDISDDGLKTAGISEQASSFMWTERFAKPDTFSIELPPTTENSTLFTANRIIAAENFSGIITSVKITDKKLTVGGTSLNGILSRRVIANYNWDDTVLTLVDKNCALLAEENRRFPRVIVDYTADCPGYLSSKLVYGRLSDYAEIIANSEDFGIFGRINHDTKQIELYGRYAQDRSADQTINKPVVFSDNYENMTDITYNFSNASVINRVTVFSEGNYDNLNFIDLDGFEQTFELGENSGYNLVEEFIEIDPVTASEWRSNGAGADLWTILNYERTLAKAQTTAQETLSKATDNVSCSLIVGNEWRKKFAVGDVVTVQVEKYGITINKRISEITTFISSGKDVVDAVLGEPTKTLSDLLRKRR